MSRLIEQIKQKDACAFTHGGKFHADDVFSSALLLYINPEISITRGNSVPDDFTGIVFDIGRGEFDHHQKDSRIRENGVNSRRDDPHIHTALGRQRKGMCHLIRDDQIRRHEPAVSVRFIDDTDIDILSNLDPI